MVSVEVSHLSVQAMEAEPFALEQEEPCALEQTAKVEVQSELQTIEGFPLEWWHGHWSLKLYLSEGFARIKRKLRFV